MSTKMLVSKITKHLIVKVLLKLYKNGISVRDYDVTHMEIIENLKIKVMFLSLQRYQTKRLHVVCILHTVIFSYILKVI
jgi:hypothetical protein